jgi:SAM-dependent methyltransferase
LERSEYERLAAAEERMWWFQGLHANLLRVLRETRAPQRILDAGCGTGGFMKRLAAAFPDATVLGLDLDAVAAHCAQAKGGGIVAIGSIDRLPFADGAFDAAVSADVLCHRGVDEHCALAELGRCLRPGGLLALNLPAYRWLYSGHDLAVDNARRYAMDELHRLLAAAGFERVRMRYWNSLLFPLMLLRRKLWRGSGRVSEVALGPAPVERSFGAVLALERRLLAAGLALPFGGSILATAVKP